MKLKKKVIILLAVCACACSAAALVSKTCTRLALKGDKKVI